MRLTIRWKLVLSIGLPVLLVYMAVLWIGFSYTRTQALTDRRSIMLELTLRRAATLDGRLMSVANAAGSLASLLATMPDLSADMQHQLLTDAVAIHADVFGMAIAPVSSDATSADKSARVALYAYHTPDGGVRSFNLTDRYDFTQPRWQWYHQPIAEKKPLWTEPYYEQAVGDIAVCAYAVPVQVNGRITAVVKADFRLSQLRQDMRSMALDRSMMSSTLSAASTSFDSEFAIVAPNGLLIAYSGTDHLLHHTIFDLATPQAQPDIHRLVAILLSGAVGDVQASSVIDDEPTWLFYTPIHTTGWTYVAIAPQRKFMEPVYAQLQLTGAVSITGLAIVLGVLLISAFRITRPLEKLDHAVKKLATGDLNVQVETINQRDEIGDLARAFDTMVIDLRSSMQRWAEEHAAREAVEHDLRVARSIQKSLLPKPLIDPENRFRLSAMNVSARHIGGDFYDYYFVNETQLMFTLGDVSGKGVPAALFMAVTRTLLRELARPGRSPAEILTQANEQLLDSNAGAMFVTVYLGLYDVTTGRLTYASAAHPLAHCLRSDNTACTSAEATGTVLGILSGQTFENQQMAIEPGDKLIVFTDGFPEARTPSGEFYGDERFLKLLQQHGHNPSDQFCREIVDEVANFQEHNLRDDMTILMLQRLASTTAPTPSHVQTHA